MSPSPNRAALLVTDCETLALRLDELLRASRGVAWSISLARDADAATAALVGGHVDLAVVDLIPALDGVIAGLNRVRVPTLVLSPHPDAVTLRPAGDWRVRVAKRYDDDALAAALQHLF